MFYLAIDNAVSTPLLIIGIPFTEYIIVSYIVYNPASFPQLLIDNSLLSFVSKLFDANCFFYTFSISLTNLDSGLISIKVSLFKDLIECFNGYFLELMLSYYFFLSSS
jgi:hypothetical protein